MSSKQRILNTLERDELITAVERGHDGWLRTTIGHLLTLEYGKALPARRRKPGHFPVFGASGVVGYHEVGLVKGPGIVVGRKGTAGSVHYTESSFWPIDTTYYVVSELADYRWLAYALTAANLPALRETTGVPGLNRNTVYAQSVLLPPLPEQRKIVAILAAADEFIARTEAVIAQLQVVRKAMMRELFTRGLPGRHTRFKKTAIGNMPESWQVATVADIAARDEYACTGGPFGSDLSSKHYVARGVPVIRGCNVPGDHRWLVEDRFVYVSENKADELSRNLACAGDIIITQRGTLGQIARIRPHSRWPRFVVSQSQMKLTVDTTRIDPDFVVTFFQSPAGQRIILGSTVATGVPHINLGALKAFPVPVPSLDEQHEITRAIMAVENRAHEERAELRALVEVKSALMSVLLSGEARVTGALPSSAEPACTGQ